MWTMAAPALAASMQDWAISAGETGTAGVRLGESAEPVTAQGIMILRCIWAWVPRCSKTPAPKCLAPSGLHFSRARFQLENADAAGRILSHHLKFGLTGQT